MTAAATGKLAPKTDLDAALLGRIAREGYGDGAWHGPDLKAALSDVSAELAFWRPAKGRHNIAEIAAHHAFTTRSVRARLSGKSPEPFPLDGEDWFDLSDGKALSWKKIQELVASQQEKLERTITDLGAGRLRPTDADVKPFDLVLGIAAHAIYHAGQIQLIKKLSEK